MAILAIPWSFFLQENVETKFSSPNNWMLYFHETTEKHWRKKNTPSRQELLTRD
jgi:hypothetical protein